MQAPLFGLGFRTQHASEIARAPRAVDWFEVLSDHYLGVGGVRGALLLRLRADHPVALHGVSLSIAGDEPLDATYLAELRELALRFDPLFVSDHLCWTALGGHQSHDLLPVACTEAVLAHVAARVAHAQEILGRRLLLENASAYVAFRAREMEEAEFLAELCRRTGCGVLLDVNNLVVNAANLGTDPKRALETLPRDAVGYLHLAGHAVLPDVRIDTHDADVPGAVWTLFEDAARRFPEAGVILERDDQIPEYPALVAELDEARARHGAVLASVERLPAGPQAERSPARSEPTRGFGSGEASGAHGDSWRELQRAFFSRIVDAPLGREQGDLAGLLDETLPVPAARGLRVYSDAYRASGRQALATNFAALARVLAPADFEGLAAAYLRAHPPRGFDFVRLGRELPAFVRTFAFAADYGVPPEVLAELAALEQAQLEVQDATDAPGPVSPAELAAFVPEDWERLRVVFAPAFRVLRASHDVAPVIEAVARGESPARPASRAVAYLVRRAGDGVRTERLAAHEASFLEALLAGVPFGSACERAAGSGTEPARVAEDAARRLVEAAAAGLLARVDLPPPSAT
jgi:uncharacterized protein (UPF0276 family)